MRPGLESLKDGIAFLKRAPNIRLQFVMDIVAMTFGQPLALFPALGMVLLGGGPVTAGILTAAIAAGAFLSSLFSGRVGGYRWHGRGIARAVEVYGAAIGAFALALVLAAVGVGAPNGVDADHANIAMIVAACVALAVGGAADNVSAIYRSTMLQAAVPDAVRGRLQGIFIVVVAGGPRIGALYAGTLATITTLWFPPLVGGILIIAIVATLARLYPGFRSYDAENPVP